jgi:hypothetical protein
VPRGPGLAARRWQGRLRSRLKRLSRLEAGLGLVLAGRVSALPASLLIRLLPIPPIRRLPSPAPACLLSLLLVLPRPLTVCHSPPCLSPCKCMEMLKRRPSCRIGLLSVKIPSQDGIAPFAFSCAAARRRDRQGRPARAPGSAQGRPPSAVTAHCAHIEAEATRPPPRLSPSWSRGGIVSERSIWHR